MPITYIVAEADGFRHERTHRVHQNQVYRFAVVREPGNGDEMQFFVSHHLAHAALVAARQRRWAAGTGRGALMFPKAALYPVTVAAE